MLKTIGKIAAVAGAVLVSYEISKGSSGSFSEYSDSEDERTRLDPYDDDHEDRAYDDPPETPDESDHLDERSSPKEHTVPAHGQHYHTREGVVWKEKEAYPRGGKHEDDKN